MNRILKSLNLFFSELQRIFNFEQNNIEQNDVGVAIGEFRTSYTEEKQNNGGKLEKLDLSELPDYISKNSNKFQEWID